VAAKARLVLASASDARLRTLRRAGLVPEVIVLIRSTTCHGAVTPYAFCTSAFSMISTQARMWLPIRRAANAVYAQPCMDA